MVEPIGEAGHREALAATGASSAFQPIGSAMPTVGIVWNLGSEQLWLRAADLFHRQARAIGPQREEDGERR